MRLPRSRHCRHACPASRADQIPGCAHKLTCSRQGIYPVRKSKIAIDRAHLLIEKAAALGRLRMTRFCCFPSFDGFWAANYMAFNGERCVSLPRSFWHSRKSKGPHPDHDWASAYGHLFVFDGRRYGRLRTLRPGARPLRSCPASVAGDAIWPRCQRCNFVVPVVGPLDAWIYRGSIHRLGTEQSKMLANTATMPPR